MDILFAQFKTKLNTINLLHLTKIIFKNHLSKIFLSHFDVIL